MKRTVSTKSVALISLAFAALAVFPSIATANIFLEESTETIPAKTIPTGEPTITASKFPVTVSGKRLELLGQAGKLTVLNLGTSAFNCSGVEISGGTLSGPVKSLDLTPKYSGCTYKGYSATVEMKSCKYGLTDIEPMGTDYGTTVTGAISCNSGDEITLNVSGCLVTIPPQQLKVSSEMANIAPKGEKELAASILGSGATYKVVSTFLCNFVSLTKGTYENGTMQSDIVMQGS